MSAEALHDPFSALSPADQHALCQRFSLPTPTPDVPLRVICADRSLTSEQMYADLAATTDVRLMIAAHALRCGVKTCPPDPQLKPAKTPPLRHAPPRAAKTPPAHVLYVTGDADAPDLIKDRNGEVVLGLCRACGKAESQLDQPCVAPTAPKPTEPRRPRTRVPPEHVLTRLAPNPRKRGTETYDRYECYQLGCTVAELEARGVRRGDIIWDLDRDYVEFGPPRSPTGE